MKTPLFQIDLARCRIGRLCFFGAWLLAAFCSLADTGPAVEDKPVSQMSLEDLVKVQVAVGTLAGSERRAVPATITTITSQDIKESGARSLDELLEIYVPNMLYLRHNWGANHIGFRGIIGDEDNKFLILVNGKVMNNFAQAGAMSERDLSMLGDIKEIQVIRGPGSSVYGAGALIGVIDIKTFDGTTFTGTEATVRAGELEEFYEGEIKSGFQLTDRAHLFLYAGISDLAGANNADAPYIMGISGSTVNGTPIVAGHPYPVPLPEDRQMFHGVPPLKLHAELTLDDFSLWARYTQGGDTQPFEQRWLIQPPQGFPDNKPPLEYQIQGQGYQQFSLGADYKHEINDHWEISGRAGFSMDDIVRTEFDGLLDANREDIYTARLLATWKLSSVNSLSFGGEYMHAEYGLSPFGYPGGRARSVAWAGVNPTPNGVSGFMPRWGTDTYSFLAEDRWDIASKWSIFTDLRIDKSADTSYLFSPRGALIYTPSSRDTFKLILSQAVKSDVAETIEFERETSGATDDTETLRAAELSYTHLLGEHISLSANAFFNDFHIIGWDDAASRSQPVGDADIAGVELEADYQSKNFRLGLSHGVSQLVDFRNSVGGIEGQAITSQPYGFGHDLNQWSTQITKLHFAYQPLPKLSLTGSLRIFWGWPGYKAYTDYANGVGTDANGDPLEFLRDPKYDPYDKIQARLNLGVTYQFNQHLSAGVHGYNLLGLFDSHLNDRFIMFSSSAQQDATAVAMTLSYKF
ncbi:MAG TPA: TonB-dependent receptor [Verrucomicrobiae bacterium]|jgi:iron complex outermembrane receptor protein|nr:TonB-dependent receptor [Verrucomicrobiae bacterium]